MGRGRALSVGCRRAGPERSEPRGEERVQRGAGLRRAGVLGLAREQARAAWARAGGGERELGLARVVCWASLSWVWIFYFPSLF